MEANPTPGPESSALSTQTLLQGEELVAKMYSVSFICVHTSLQVGMVGSGGPLGDVAQVDRAD